LTHTSSGKNVAQKFYFQAVQGSCGYSLGLHGKESQTSLGSLEPANFGTSNFGRHIFVTFRVETNIIMWRREVPYRLSSDPEMLDLDMP